MKRALRRLALIVATIFGTALVLDLPAASKKDASAMILIGVIFASAIAGYLYLTRSLRKIPK
jgi:hypothetical protein